MNGIVKVFFGLIAIVAVAAAAVAYLAFSFVNTPATSSTEVTVFEVRPGQSFKTTARRLEEAGLVKNARKLELFARFTGATKKMKVGEYALRRNATPKDILDVITSGRSIEYVVTVQEGFNIFEIADLLEQHKVTTKAEFIELTRNKQLIQELLGEELTSLEGYLFPETYHITKFTGARGLIKLMVDRFKENYANVVLPVHPSTGKKMTRHELVTLASIIEKETGAPEERPLISSVFHNRLKLKMRLQTDPTVIYGVWEQTGKWNRNISRADLMTANRYNTYTIEGLPYGPISNPGRSALVAASLPAQSEFLFFVSQNNGTHIFSKDYSGHQKAVTKFQIDRKAREGKSWRDLNKSGQKRGQSTGAGTGVDGAAAAAGPKKSLSTVR